MTLKSEYAAWLTITVVEFDSRRAFNLFLLPVPQLLAGTTVDIYTRMARIVTWLRLVYAGLAVLAVWLDVFNTMLDTPIERPRCLVQAFLLAFALADWMDLHIFKVDPLTKQSRYDILVL